MTTATPGSAALLALADEFEAGSNAIDDVRRSMIVVALRLAAKPDQDGVRESTIEPISERDLADLLANTIFAENLDEMPTEREEHGPSWCQGDMIDAAREIQQAGYVITKTPVIPRALATTGHPKP